MTGAEHYREAEQCLTNARNRNQPDDPWLATDLAEAQVHATLALAAATAYPTVKDYLGDEAREMRDWTAATERKQARS